MRHIRQILFFPFIWLVVTSCWEDRSGEYYALIGENVWIEQVMSEHYLWYDHLPEMSQNDYISSASTFFSKLLYSGALDGKGDSYSYIESKSSPTRSLQRSSTYGFEFELMSDPTRTTSHTFARVLYVLPDSPASEAGLVRGDWISAIGTNLVTTGNYTGLMSGDSARFARESVVFDADGNATGWQAVDTVEIGASRTIELDPFFVDTVYTVGGKKIAYLMYNEFSTGPDNLATDETYRNRMRELFIRFKGQSPDAFILDLRYNPGGYLSCANDLASYLAPASALGNTFCILQYNDITSPQEASLLLEAELAAGNLDLNTLYVLTTSSTASASEAVINCLAPYLGAENIIVIGETTEGKPVAMEPYEDERYDYVLYPVVAYVLNAEREADYVKGITPDFVLSESALLEPLSPLGDTDEYLLKNAIALITTGSILEVGQALSPVVQVPFRCASFGQRSLNGIRLR